MKVLFDHPNPFLLAHGGFQIQIEQTKAALERNGLEVEYLRWWDQTQTGDIIHYFGRPAIWYIDFAHRKDIPVVLCQLLSGVGSRSQWQLAAQRICTRLGAAVLPKIAINQFGWKSFQLADACIANTPWEAHLMNYIFAAPASKIQVVPNGVEDIFFQSPSVQRGPWLVCTSTITERKRILELSQAAIVAGTPLWIIGRAYADSDPYAREFFALAQKHPDIIRYEGAINERTSLARIYREARGFVLLSTMETRSLSSEEAAACECPLLLSDLPWARSVFSHQAHYCPVTSIAVTARILRNFYDLAPSFPIPGKPLTWPEIGARLKTIYESLCNNSR